MALEIDFDATPQAAGFAIGVCPLGHVTLVLIGRDGRHMAAISMDQEGTIELAGGLCDAAARDVIDNQEEPDPPAKRKTH